MSLTGLPCELYEILMLCATVQKKGDDSSDKYCENNGSF